MVGQIIQATKHIPYPLGHTRVHAALTGFIHGIGGIATFEPGRPSQTGDGINNQGEFECRGAMGLNQNIWVSCDLTVR